MEAVEPERAWLAARVRALRMIRGYSQQELAEHSDVAVDTIRRLELGCFSPSISTLAKVARGLGVCRAFLVEFEGSPAEEIGVLIAALHGKPNLVVRLAVRAALAIVIECEAVAIESSNGA